jgi:hypothetical protein
LPADDDGDGTDGDVREGGPSHRGSNAEERQDGVRARDRSKRAAERIEGVESAQAPAAHVGGMSSDDARKDWQRSSHRHRGNDDDGRGEPCARRGYRGERVGRRARDENIELGDDIERGGRQRAGCTHQELEHAVRDEWPRSAPAEAAAQAGAER